MPITITPEAFKAGTSHPVWSRLDSKLHGIDFTLSLYFWLQQNNPSGDELIETLDTLLRFIEMWAQGKRTQVDNGVLRYRDWRDRKGLISRLEREARQTLQELHLVVRNVGAGLVGKRMIPDRRSAPQAPVRVSQHVSAPQAPGRLSLRASVPQALGPQLPAVADRPGLPPNTPLRRGSVDAAARLLALTRLEAKLKGQQKLPDAADVAGAISQATGIAAPILQISVQFEQIALGLDQLGYSVEHVRRCDLAGLNAALARATPTNPVLLCVGDRAPDHAWNGPGGRAHGPAAQAVHAVICTGRGGKSGSGEGFDVEDFHFGSRRCVLFDDGDYFAHDPLGGDALMTAEPSLGYIRVRRGA